MIKRALALIAGLAMVAVAVPLLGPAEQSDAAPIQIGRVHESFQPEDGKIFILFMGSDARHGNPNSRADAIHLVGINTDKMRGGIINIPRDSWVNIPGYGSAKINEGLYHGGPELMAKTVENVTGIRIDYWVMTGFEGFQGLIRDVGGIHINLKQDVYDIGWSGANLKKGKQVVKGAQALAYNRARHAFGGGDITRTTNQGRFLLSMLRELRNEVQFNPSRLLTWIAAGRQHTRFNVSPDEQFRLGVLASQLSPKDIGNVTVPVSVGAVGAASVVFISPGANDIYKRLRANAYL
ncbi:MAG: LCP family protein [Actinomycetota bacterium]